MTRHPIPQELGQWERCLHTVVSSVRSCWFKLLLSSRRESRLWIFSSLSSRVFFSADSIFVSRILYLLEVEKVKFHVICRCRRVDRSETGSLWSCYLLGKNIDNQTCFMQDDSYLWNSISPLIETQTLTSPPPTHTNQTLSLGGITKHSGMWVVVAFLFF